VVCLGAAYTRLTPVTGGSPIEDLAATGTLAPPVPPAPAPVPFWLVHGTEDATVPAAASREFAALLARRGWPVRLEEQPTDHAGVIGTEYDPLARRCVPATAGPAVAAGRLSAWMIAEAAGAPGVLGASGAPGMPGAPGTPGAGQEPSG
jgi:hypothetical protein